MQPAHRAGAQRNRVIVLHELRCDAEGGEHGFAVRLGEHAARIAMALRSNEFHIRNERVDHLHGGTLPPCRSLRARLAAVY